MGLNRDDVVAFLKEAVVNFFSELIATGTFLAIGCSSVAASTDTGFICLAFSIAAYAGIEVASHVSGGHINPMLTTVAILFKKVKFLMGLVYMLGQFCGATIGVAFVRLITPPSVFKREGGFCVCNRDPEVSLMESAIGEFIGSCALCLVTCAQWDPRNENFAWISFKIAISIYTIAYGMAYYSGGGLNPARAFGAALVSLEWKDHWIYWVCPYFAAIFSFAVYKFFFIYLSNKLKPQPPEED